MPTFIIGRVNRPDLLEPSAPVGDRGGKCYWGGLAFASSPVVHETLKKAEAERDKLAAANPGAAFIVFEAISAAHTATPPLKIVSFKCVKNQRP